MQCVCSNGTIIHSNLAHFSSDYSFVLEKRIYAMKQYIYSMKARLESVIVLKKIIRRMCTLQSHCIWNFATTKENNWKFTSTGFVANGHTFIWKYKNKKRERKKNVERDKNIGELLSFKQHLEV